MPYVIGFSTGALVRLTDHLEALSIPRDLDPHCLAAFRASSKTTSDQGLDHAFDLRGHHYSGEEHFELSGTTRLELSAKYDESH